MPLVGSLAQLVEQLTLNQLVGGSNPPRPTNKFKGLHENCEPFVFLEIPEEKIRSKTQPKVLLLNF